MYSLDDIMRIDNFDNLTVTQLLEIINTIKNDLKNIKYRRDLVHDKLQLSIDELTYKLNEQTVLIDKYKTVISNYHKMYDRKLTFKERVMGKINNNTTIERHKKNI